MEGLIVLYIFGLIGMSAGGWIRYDCVKDNFKYRYSGRSRIDENEEREDLKEVYKAKYQACVASLLSLIWPIGIPALLIKHIIDYNKQEKKKELQQCICPECERKFLQE